MGHVQSRRFRVDHDSGILGVLPITDSDCQSMLENVRHAVAHWHCICAMVRHSAILYSPRPTPYAHTVPGASILRQLFS